MQKWYFFIAVILCFGGFTRIKAWKKTHQQEKTVTQALQQGGEALRIAGIPKNCENKSYCITVYVAPWCPACKSSQGAFRTLNSKLPKMRSDIGFGLIVGSASQQEIDQEIKVLSPIETYSDTNGALLKIRNVASFPTWIVHDRNGKEISRKAGGISSLGENDLDRFLKQFLGI